MLIYNVYYMSYHVILLMDNIILQTIVHLIYNVLESSSRALVSLVYRVNAAGKHDYIHGKAENCYIVLNLSYNP